MTVNLRAEFRERKQKRLNEAIEFGSSSKKQRTGEKGLSSRLIANASSMSIPPSPPTPKAQNTESIHF